MRMQPILLFVVAVQAAAFSQIPGRDAGFNIGQTVQGSISSNSINDILTEGNTVWVGTSKGLMRSTDGESWNMFTRNHGLGKGGISAIAVKEGVVWVATAFDTVTELGTFDAGGGLAVSEDNGHTWRWIPQPVDPVNTTEYKPTTTNIQNITYDIAITDSAVWITSFGGGLRKSTNHGVTWEVVTVDGLPFDALGHLTHRAFSVIADGNTLWVGSAGGVHRSMDGGRTWANMSHQNQAKPLSGNFVVALCTQDLGNRHILWAATIEALEAEEFRAVSYSDDMGLTWTTVLDGEFAHNFAVDEATGTVYAATDNGVFKSNDGGETWAVFPLIEDPVSGARILTTVYTSAGVIPQRSLWLGSVDGLARSLDNGLNWSVFRAFQKTDSGPIETYAYPNPFSPLRHNVVGEDGYVRFQYFLREPGEVTVKVFDFAMNLVATVAENAFRQSGDLSEVWNGRNDLGDLVANGVYFYKIIREKGSPLWGKVMIVN